MLVKGIAQDIPVLICEQILDGYYRVWILWSVDIMEYGYYEVWILRSMDIMECGYYGVWILWSMDIIECGDRLTLCIDVYSM